MNKIWEMLKKFGVFLVNILIFMFLRRTFVEHVLLLCLVLTVSLALGLLVGIPIYLDVISLSSEPWPALVWIMDSVESFLDIEKLRYVGLTYTAALVVFLASDIAIGLQNKRQKIPLGTLKEELKVNSRALIIVMSGALSLIFKILIGLVVILLLVTYFSDPLIFSHINMTYTQMFVIGGSFLWIDLVLFIICKFLIPPMKACLEVQEQVVIKGPKESEA
ncbi:hypothetical protein KW524_08650 [Vibrio fluvialis]|jgi:hypothetical protein|nr:hypothetical protein [Vibrio fluvialis]